MAEISTSKLKTHCSEVVAQVARTREPIVITRRGRPIARIVPLDEPTESLFGFLRGHLAVRGDLLEPIDVSWEAME